MAAGMGEQRDLRIPEHLQLPVDGRQGDSHMEPEPEGVDDGQPRSEHGETDLQVTLSQTGTCWQMHMILRAVRSTSCGYHRHYRPTASEREGSDFQQDGGRDYMDVDNPQPPEGHDDEAKSPNNRSVLKPPPTDMDWWDFENLFKYIKRHKKKKKTGMLTTNQLKEFIRIRLASCYSRTYPRMAHSTTLSRGMPMSVTITACFGRS